MPDIVRRVDYFAVSVSNKPGEAARILTALEQAGINLTAFSGFPEGRRAQMDFVPSDAAAFKAAAKKEGLNIGPKKTCFIVHGEDRPGAVAGLARKLAEASINITAGQAITAGEDRYAVLLWVKPEDVRKTAKVLGAQ
jgi:hypothetical protein